MLLYIERKVMKINLFHSWKLSPEQACKIQKELAGRVVKEDRFSQISTICGVDVSIRGDAAWAGCVVMSFPDLDPLDYSITSSYISFPYIPGLLSFREIPALIPAIEKLRVEPDLFLVDGQGFAHPRRFGLASHVGLLYNKPSVGCAKSKLIGTFREPGDKKGNREYLYDGEEIIGVVLRTRDNVKPLFISVGQNISINSAMEFVLKSCTRYRIPEPLRLAHQAACGNLPW